MDRTPQYADALMVFATHGFERTTMAQLAEAVGVSRQTLYKRHGSKDQVLTWAVLGFAGQSEDRAIAAIRAAEQGTEDRLLAFFGEWVGSLVAIYRGGPYGPEVLDRGSAIRERETVDPRARCWVELTRMLYETGASPSLDDADDRAFTLTIVGKGLLMTSKTFEEFDASMRRALRICVTL